MNILTAMMAFVVLVVFVMAMDYGVKFFIEWIIDVFTNNDECHTEEGF